MTETTFSFAPGAAGELIQGQFPSGRNFLVSLPINIYSKARFILNECDDIQINISGKTKVLRAVKMLLAILSENQISGRLEIHSDIPEGKGLASSTADITAACYAVGKALDYDISPDLVAQVTRLIEPSDGIMYPGLVTFDHVACELVENLGVPPDMEIIILDFGKTIDTLAFNQIPKRYTFQDIDRIQHAYNLVKKGIQTSRPSLLGKAGIISARVNQKLHHKKELEDIIAMVAGYQGLGVNIGHSGTIINALFKPDQKVIPEFMDQVRLNFPSIDKIYRTRIVSTIPVQKEVL